MPNFTTRNAIETVNHFVDEETWRVTHKEMDVGALASTLNQFCADAKTHVGKYGIEINQRLWSKPFASVPRHEYKMHLRQALGVSAGLVSRNLQFSKQCRILRRYGKQ